MPIIQTVPQSITNSGALTFTITPPAVGNTLFAGISLYNGANSTITPPDSSWSTLVSVPNSIDGLNYGGIIIFQKIAIGNETTLTFTDSSGGQVLGGIVEISSISTDTPIDNYDVIYTKQASGTPQSSQSSPAVIPQFQGSIPLVFFCMYDPTENQTPYDYPFTYGWSNDGVLQETNMIFGVSDRSQLPTFEGDGGGVSCVMGTNIGNQEVYWTTATLLISQNPPVIVNCYDAFYTMDMLSYSATKYTGSPGNGSTVTTRPILIQPIGTNIPVYVKNANAFPMYSYALVTDGSYSFVGYVQNQDLINQILLVRIVSVGNANLGSTVSPNATVTFSGPPGAVGTTSEVGTEGTVQYQRLLLTPDSTMFNSEQGLTSVTALGNINVYLPGVLQNGLCPDFDVIAELTCSIATNQNITNPLAYVGIAATQFPKPGTATQNFAGYTNPPQPAPMIPSTNCIADAALTASSVNSSGTSGHAFFSGTYASNSNISFSILASAIEFNINYYVSANLKITAYPLYGTNDPTTPINQNNFSVQTNTSSPYSSYFNKY